MRFYVGGSNAGITNLDPTFTRLHLPLTLLEVAAGKKFGELSLPFARHPWMRMPVLGLEIARKIG